MLQCHKQVTSIKTKIKQIKQRTEKKTGIRINRKTVIKSIKKGGLGLLDIWKLIHCLKLIWMCKLLIQHKWRFFFFFFFNAIMFPIIITLAVRGPCLPLRKDISFGSIHSRPRKAFVAKSVQWRLKSLWQNLCFTVTTFKLETRQYYIEDGLKRSSVASLIFYMNTELFCALWSLIWNTV